ncbi:Phosphorylated carbohydrates phosphatase [Hordeum vulgare]|nr:Phosphorylated carbohydrates phosphatase [Hordeum vulgare]
MLVEPDKEECHLAWVCRRSLAAVETGTRCLRWKNAKALRLAIEQSEREAKEAAKEKARLSWWKREQDRAVRRMKGFIVLSDDDSDDNDNDNSPDDDQDPSPAADGYSCASDLKAKFRRGSGDLPPSSLYIVNIVFR